MFSAPYGLCHYAPYVYCHSAPYLHSAVIMNVPVSRTASRQNDAPASHSCHFNTVLYPRSYSECQLPLNRSRRDNTGVAFSVHNCGKIFALTALSSMEPLQACQHIYNAI